jgi:hypothetical protein
MPIPLYDPTKPAHEDLAALAERAAAVAAQVELTAQTFQVLRRNIRHALGEDGVASEIDEAVRNLLA